MKSKLVITYTATCECNEELIETFFTEHIEYWCTNCNKAATVEESPTFGVVGEIEVKVKYAIGPTPGSYTHGAYETVYECLDETPNNNFIFAIGGNIPELLYKAVGNQWIKC